MNWTLVTGRVRIVAPPVRIWPWLAEPRSWPVWNPKVGELLPLSVDAPRAGYRFRLTYRPGKRSNRVEAEIVEFRAPEQLVCRISGGDLAPGGVVFERYSLRQAERGTLLTHSVDLGQSRMPVLARVAAVVMARLFNPRGELGHVANLKALIEDGVPPPEPA